MSAPVYYLGVDGGGTGCRARIEDGQGRVLGAGVAGPAAVRMGLAAAWESVSAAVAAALHEAGLTESDAASVRAGFALAGLSRKGTGDKLAELQLPYASVAFTTDAHGAFLGAHSGGDGAIVIVGTGSVGIGYVEGKELRVGGYGFPISDEGSGAMMGLSAVQLALRAYDGRTEKSPFLVEILKRFNNDSFDAVAWMDGATASDYATFAPMVMQHASAGDGVAEMIVREAAAHIDQFVRTIIERGAPRVALVGGLAGPIEPWLSDDVRVELSPPEGDAVAGAIILAKRFTG